MTSWNNVPLIRLILPFISGIILALTFPYHPDNSFFFIFLLLFIIATVLIILQSYFSYKNGWWCGWLINNALLLLGYQLTLSKTEKFFPEHFSHQATNYAYLHITQAPVKRTKSVKVIAEVLSVKNKSRWTKTKGKAIVYFQKSEKNAQLHYGDNIIAKTRFMEVPLPQNPDEFDYKSYLSNHNIYHQAFLKSSQWSSTGINKGNKLITASIELRNNLLKSMSGYGIRGNEFAVGSALLLGYEDELNPELLSAYSSAGVIHLLSVSGLHVGIVYLVFNWLFFFFEKTKKGKIVKAILLILIIWFYAALTNFSPSVLRATTMFTAIAIAQAFNRHSNIYNTLAASAFLLLLMDPFILMNVGFQLSYLAVIGIVTIYPKLYTTISFNNKLIDMVWKTTSVSIAAQIAAFPLCLYYFHQFPNYFLLANMIAIPLSTLIIYLGILFFVFLKISAVASITALLFSYCIGMLNKMIQVFENLPYASFKGVYITAFEMLLIYGIIIFLCYYFIRAKFKFLMILFSFIILLLSIQLIEHYNRVHQRKMIIYNISKTSAISFVSGNNNVLLADTSFSTNKKAISFHLKNHWDNLGIDTLQTTTGNIKTCRLIIHEKHIQFHNKRIVLLKENTLHNNRTHAPLNIDYLILSNNCKLTISDILKTYHPKLIVFDSSNNRYQLQKWETECVKNNKAFYSVPSSGALVVEI